ncbi:MAG TPA: hypothetical protein VD865_04415 [Stenotrophomonas sp.]|nr:hypothetical protein [Stenotrophomonas sp.]
MNLPAEWVSPTVDGPEQEPQRIDTGVAAVLVLLAAWPTWLVLPRALVADRPEVTAWALLLGAPLTGLAILALLASLAFPKRVLWRVIAGYVVLMLLTFLLLPQVFVAAGVYPSRLFAPASAKESVAAETPARPQRTPAPRPAADTARDATARPAMATGRDATPPPAVAIATAPPSPGPASAPSPAAQLVPFEGRRDPGDCSALAAALPADTLVYAAGAYGGRPLNYQIDKKSNHEATRIDVSVDEPEKPVALMLGAYEPTVWNIGWTPRTRIAAVLVSGYHHQVVAGLPASVPQLVGSHDDDGPCPYFYVSQDKLAALNPIAQQAFQRKVTRAYLARNGAVSVGSGSGGAMVTDASRSPEGFRIADMPLAGEAGLRDALTKGLIREATRADVDGWQRAFSARNAADLPPLSGGDSFTSRGAGTPWHTYVVVQPMQLPAGLHGAHSAVFIVPRGVARPTGDPGHSRILDYNTMSCAGPTCGMSAGL